MNGSSVNPYQPPLLASERPQKPEPDATKSVFIAVLGATIAYHGFLLFLIFTSPADRFVAIVFLLNTPLLLLWLIQLKRGRSGTVKFGFCVVAVLICIGGILLATGGKPKGVGLIIGTMSSVFVTLTFVCYRNGKSLPVE